MIENMYILSKFHVYVVSTSAPVPCEKTRHAGVSFPSQHRAIASRLSDQPVFLPIAFTSLST